MEQALERARGKARIHEHAGAARLEDERVPFAAASEDPEPHPPTLHLRSYAAVSARRCASLNVTCRRAMARDATSRKRSISYVALASSVPQENGATTLGVIPEPKTFAPAPITLPVVSRVPIAVFT